nr:ulp1 protease family, C-terminal catalytic domain-containing protein [Ipomoea batatas]
MHAKTEERLVDVVPVVAGVWGVVGGPFTVGLFLMWVPHLFVLLHARQIDQLILFWGSVRPSGVHSIASVPSLDLLDDVNFSKWVLEYGSDDLKVVVAFVPLCRAECRDDIRSLAPGAEVSVGVIIVGSCILTGREHTKDPSTPTRLNTIVLFEKIVKLKLARFSETLAADFALGPYKTLGHVHLLFFPILQQNHFYLLCLDFKFKRLEIIDNSALTQPTPVKYGNTPENVKLLLSECFTSVGDEKFNREGVAKWDCGLTSGDRSQLQRLRLRYMKELCTVDINAHHTSNVARALRFLSGH